MKPKKIFKNDYDTIWGYSREEACGRYADEYGLSYGEGEDVDPDEFLELKEDEDITITRNDEDGRKETRTALEWAEFAEQNNTRLICSTEE